MAVAVSPCSQDQWLLGNVKVFALAIYGMHEFLALVTSNRHAEGGLNTN